MNKISLRRGFNLRLVLTLTAICVTILSAFVCFRLETARAAGSITGRVFQDFNGNGNYDTAGVTTAVDAGIGNVTISAFDSQGAVRGTANTASDGTFALSATGTGPYRIEFTNLPANFKPSARGTDSVSGGTATDSGSTVQFVPDGATSNVNLALNRPEEYCQNNPQLLTCRFAEGAQNGTYANNGVLIDFQYSAGTTYGDTTVAN